MGKNNNSSRVLHPCFVCIGAQKAGTTWLYDNLCQHPGVWMPPVKEIHFFNTVSPNEQLLGIETYNHLTFKQLWRVFLKNPSLENLRWLKKFYWEHKTIQWYYEMFAISPTGKCSGDITPGYSTLDDRGVAFARKVLPNHCNVFIILRNPIERIWSGIKMNYRWKGGDIQHVNLAVLAKEMRIASHYLRTDYSRMIKLWEKYFPNNFKIFLYDDLRENPACFLASIEEYIGINKFINPKILVTKSNADKRRIKMPSEVKKFLLSEYTETIYNLESYLPGIKERWL
ncbi:MAG TPA: sulfotransferase [Gammaproteobacteria bacterium]|nr:sulfotransferase [Gammaproteobacteria bacterium]